MRPFLRLLGKRRKRGATMKVVLAVKVEETFLRAIDEVVAQEAKKIRESDHVLVEVTRSDVLRQLLKEGLEAIRKEMP